MYNSSSVEDILATISEAGFKVAMQKEMQLTREMAEEFYKEHKGQDYFEELITRMTWWWSLLIHKFRYKHGGVCVVENYFDFAFTKLKFWQIYIAKSTCKDFFYLAKQKKFHVNNSHECLIYLLLKIIPVVQFGSMKCWFPGCNSIIKNKTAAWSWYSKVGCFRTVQDLLNLQIQWIFFYVSFPFFVAVDYKNCNQLFFCSGPVLALGLAREDAITGWRHMLGPTEVEKAKSEAPERWINLH